MADKEILAVEIDDSAFSEFKRKFDEYQTAVKALPVQWQKSGIEITAQKTTFEKMVKSADEQNRSTAVAATSQGQFNRLLDATSLTFGSLHKSGKLFAGNIVHATQHLAHWTKLTAVFSGLLGAGGLFGINRMAASVAAQRTSAIGLGVTYGEQASFLTNFGRLGNAEGILQGFSEAETDVSKKYALRQYLGHTESGDPAKDFAEGLGRFKQFVDQYKDQPGLLGPMLQARGYDKLGIGTEQARIVQGMSVAEIAQISRGYRGDVAGRLGLSDADAKKWTEFSNQMERAGLEIETVFAKRSVGLAKPLEHLSESFVHLTENLLKDGSPISGWIKDLGRGIRTFADELGSGAVQDKAAEVGRNIADTIKLFDAILAKAPGGLAVLLGIGVAARFGGAAVAAGTALARSRTLGVLGEGAAIVLGPAGALAAGGLVASTTPASEGENERERQRRYHQGPFAPEHMKQRHIFGHRQRTFKDHSGGGQAYFDKGGYGPFSHDQTAGAGQDFNVPGLGKYHPIAGDVSDIPWFNLGNIRAKKGGWRKFDTPSDAAHGIIGQLSRYPKMFPRQHDVDTLAGALKRYAPRGDRNNPEEYARQVEQWTGIPKHSHMQLDDPEVEAKLAYGFARKEGHLQGRNIEDFRGMFIRHGAPLRRSFGHPHVGHHPATIGRVDNPITVQDNTGGLVSIGAN